ncbi:hypothetical protein [uncultured Draconibacterium sp.]|uniref:hypothetical protein n=1 Tax=uncultured Draconibacterium sp. TaxID=1573823 RepID=UPI0025D781A1|nr:hypothetical protein [uncultured Draconibacterium sp.]
MKTLIKLAKGFVTDFWMLPLAIVIMIQHEYIVEQLQLMPTLNEVKVGNIVPTIVIFLLIMFFVRLYFLSQYPDVYRKSLMNEKNGTLWPSLSPWRQFIVLRLERWVLILSATLIFLAMF